MARRLTTTEQNVVLAKVQQFLSKKPNATVGELRGATGYSHTVIVGICARNGLKVSNGMRTLDSAILSIIGSKEKPEIVIPNAMLRHLGWEYKTKVKATIRSGQIVVEKL